MRNFINIINETLEERTLQTFRIFVANDEMEKVRDLLAAKNLRFEEKPGLNKIDKNQILVKGDDVAKRAMIRAIKMARLETAVVGQPIREEAEELSIDDIIEAGDKLADKLEQCIEGKDVEGMADCVAAWRNASHHFRKEN